MLMHARDEPMTFAFAYVQESLATPLWGRPLGENLGCDFLSLLCRDTG